MASSPHPAALEPVAAPPRQAQRQLILDLPHAVGRDLADFLPAASNRAALDAVLRWPDWPATACLLVGPPGSGKSHLAAIWVRRAQAVSLTGPDVWEPAEPLRRLGAARACVVDDADELADEALLFHLYNMIGERRGSLMLTASRPVAAWGLTLPDLRSRLLTAWQVAIGPPNDELLAALLVKQFADRQLKVEAEVVSFLVPRIERSFAAVRSLVRALDRASLRARRPLTLPLARLVLAELERHEPRDREQG